MQGRDNGQNLEIPWAEHGNFPEYFHQRTGVKPSPKVGMMGRSQVRDGWPTGGTGADGIGAVLVAKTLSSSVAIQWAREEVRTPRRSRRAQPRLLGT